MTNNTVVASQAVSKPSDIYEEGAVVFLLHGPMVRMDLSGFSETLKLPYVGTNVLSSECGYEQDYDQAYS